jgi:uncharacterized protein YqeY
LIGEIMSELKSKLKAQVVESMKARDAARTQTLRTVLSAIQKKEIDESKDLDDPGILKVLQTVIKQLNETIDQAKSLSRAEIVSAAEMEIRVIKEFLPATLSEAEVKTHVSKLVNELKSSGKFPANPGAAMGQVMKTVMAQIGSQTDGKTIQAAVKAALGV